MVRDPTVRMRRGDLLEDFRSLPEPIGSGETACLTGLAKPFRLAALLKVGVLAVSRSPIRRGAEGMGRPDGPGRAFSGQLPRPDAGHVPAAVSCGKRCVNGRRFTVDSVQIFITVAAMGSMVVGWRAGQLVGAGVLCILVTFIVLLQRVDIL